MKGNILIILGWLGSKPSGFSLHKILYNGCKEVFYENIMHGQQKIHKMASQQESLHRGQLPPPPGEQHVQRGQHAQLVQLSQHRTQHGNSSLYLSFSSLSS